MKNLFLLILLVMPALLWAQGNPSPLGLPSYHILDRLEIKTQQNSFFHSTFKPYIRADIIRFAKLLDANKSTLTPIDKADLRYLFRDNNEWIGERFDEIDFAERGDGDNSMMMRSLADERYEESKKKLFNYFYPTPANLIEVNERDFHLRVNPIINLQVLGEREDGNLLFVNQRGTQLRGGIDDKFYFHTRIIDNQAKFPEYVNDYVDQFESLPGAGLIKDNRNTSFGLSGGLDYLLSDGYLGFNLSKHVGVQFGYGQNFIGNGYRSLLLSNFSFNYLYLKLNWKVWKLHYQNIFSELTARTGRSVSTTLLPKKYMAAHHLNLHLFPNLSFGIFESVIFSRENRFEFQYLLPVIFYRTVEQGLGSPDNVLLGLDVKWNLWKRVQFYGQFVLDELVFSELVSNNRGWWGNKFGVQAGAKYIDAFGVDHLDLQLERNTVRPYTYSHTTATTSYTHYNQPLAHPLGANFGEWIIIGKYRPVPRLEIQGRLILADVGEDTDTTNWGGNLLLPNSSREQDIDNEIGQGLGAAITILGLDISYQLSHNVFIDVQYFNRHKVGDLEFQDQETQFLGGGIRININRMRMDF